MKREPERLPDWERRLNSLLSERAAAPFAWGSHDCALFGADVVQAITGEDFGAPFRGTYSTREGAAAALREHGRGTIVRTFDDHLHRIHKAMAQRGDLALWSGGVGVVAGTVGLFLDESGERPGFVRVPRRDWTLCWRVGR